MLRLSHLGMLLALVTTLSACDFEGGSLYDPDAPRNENPVIADVSPDGVVLAGVDQITISGQNFSTTPGDNAVVFDDGQGNSAAGVILSASPTQLVVQVPNLPNPSLRVRVAVIGAQAYSNAVDVPLTPAFVSFGEIARTEVVYGITSDADGTLYASLENEGQSVGVVRFAPSGERTAEPYFASTFPWAALARNGDQLVGVRRVRALFELPEGGTQRVLVAYQPQSLLLVGVTTGPDGTVYTGGNTPTLFSRRPDGTTAETPFPSNIRALGSAGSTLYVVGAASTDTPARLYTVAIASDGTLGTPQVLAPLPAPGNAIAVAADGTVFVGLDRAVDPVATVSPNGDVSTLYPGVLQGPATSLAYAAGTQLYMVRGLADASTPDLLRIETRREGAR